MLRIGQIKLPYQAGDDQVFGHTIKKLHIQEKDVLNWRIFKKSIDARKEEYEKYFLNKQDKTIIFRKQGHGLLINQSLLLERDRQDYFVV